MFRVLQHIIFAVFLSVNLAGALTVSAYGSDSKLATLPVSQSDLQILNTGGVLIDVAKVVDASGKSAQINSSVKIKASPEAIWAVLVDCDRAPSYVPGLKKCEILEESAINTWPDKSWDKRRHTNKPAAFLPTIKSEFRCDYTFPNSISFASTGGDMDTNSGQWTLSYDKVSGKTLVSYNARIASKTIIPDKMIRKILKKNVPTVMRTLREEVMADQAKLSGQ